MIKKITSYIYILFLVGFSNEVLSQKFILKTASKDSIENTILTKHNFKKEHLSLKELRNEIHLISKDLKTIGYFNISIDNLQKKDSVYTSYFTLGKQINTIILRNSSKRKIKLKPKQLENYLNSIANKLEKEGKSFSKTQLNNIRINNNTLYADLKTHPSEKRKINRVIVKEYPDFPKSYIKHFLGIKENSIFNKQKLKEISIATKSLSFVNELKPPETLFSKDSTLLYIYLKRKSSNSFDGLIGFNSKENGNGFIFNGYLNLKLNNILHTGEQFEVLWKANGEERQQFKVSAKTPYIFNLPLSTGITFDIYKQDSTFLNTKFHSELSYNINSKTTLSLTYDNEVSKNTLNNNLNSFINDFNNSFLGFEFTYQKPSEQILFDNKLFFRINPSFGNRVSNQTKTNQFKIELEALYLWKINYKSFIFLRNHSGVLSSKNHIDNELFRIGGIKSIRGINEESIFATKFNSTNIEYRYITSNDSYLYSISDFGISKNTEQQTNIFTSIGFGYLFSVKNSQINLFYTLNKQNGTDFGLKNSKINFTLKNYF